MSEEKKSVILVIDDQATVIRVMERMLEDEYTVLSARSGKEGIEVALNKLPDLILLDMVMPEMSGIEACQVLSANPLTSKIPVVFVTSMDDRHNEESGLKAGAVDYIYKPPSPGVVLARVAFLMEKVRQERFIEAVASGFLSDPVKVRAAAKELLGM